MSDNLSESEILRTQVTESIDKIKSLFGFGKKDKEETTPEEPEKTTSSKMVHNGGDSWTLNGNPISKLVVYNPGVDMEKTLVEYDWEGGKMSWLAKSNFSSKVLSIDLETEEVDVFVGKWDGGNYKGNIFTDYGLGRIQAKVGDSSFNGGRFLGKTLRVDYRAWRTSPYNFQGRKVDHTKEGILGLPNITGTKDFNHNGFNLIQVPAGFTIVFKTEDNQFINAISIKKRLDNTNSDTILEDVNSGKSITLPWISIRKNYDKFFITEGKVFSIPGLSETSEPIGSIEVKKSSEVTKKSIGKGYQEQKGGALTKISFGEKFPVLGRTGIKGFNQTLTTDPEALHFIKVFQNDIKNDGATFSHHMKIIKDAIVNKDKYKREVGYGKYPHLRRITDKQGAKITDEKLDASLSYLNDFIGYVVGSIGRMDKKTKKFVSEPRFQEVILNSIKSALSLKSGASEKPKSDKGSGGKAKKKGLMNMVKKSKKTVKESDLRKIIRDEIEGNETQG